MFALLKGVQLGVIIFFLVGPLFLLILEETIKSGRKAALLLALGLWVSECMFALISHFGLHSVFAGKEIDYRFGFVAALILVIAGISSIKSRNKIHEATELKFVKLTNLFLKGFLINTFNPFVLLFWLGIATQVTYEPKETQLFYFGLLSTIILGDLVKIFFSDKISQKLKPKHLVYLRVLGGALLIIFGLVIIFRIIQMQ